MSQPHDIIRLAPVKKASALRYMALSGLSALVLCTSMAAEARDKSKEGGEVRAITAEEKEQGAKAHPQLLNEFGGPFDSKQTPYVVEVGKNIAVQSGLGNAREDFTVTLLNSPVNNAFAIPGGYIYVTRNLLGLMNDEAELAGVLGHEVGHVAARHAEKRQKAAKTNAILGMIGQVASSMLLGNSGVGQLGQQLFGTGSQLLTLRYSRKQEREADYLGIEYLDKAGYDPQALSSMLYSLALQSAVEARVAGQDARGVPEWVSTHPDPAKRVRDAAKRASDYGEGGVRNREVFLNKVDGLLYGDDPAQGIIMGNEFLHPEMKLKFSVPSGYTMQNTATAVQINGQQGKAQFTLAPYKGNLDSYVDSVFTSAGESGKPISHGAVQHTTVNGLPAAYAMGQVNNGQQTVDVAVFAYEFSKTRAYHFLSITPAGRATTFNSMYGSVARLGDKEAAAVKPRKIKVVTVAEGDTIDSLSAKMAYDTMQKERFMALNGLGSDARLSEGQRVKIVIF